jgi:FMN phosphatase YigB (HAD superfamily)
VNKKIIFFDGDGTLWYPESTKRARAPHWLYADHPLPKDYLQRLALTPNLIATLRKLKERGIILVALSTHPHSRAEADLHMAGKMQHFKIGDLFDGVYTARNYPSGKGKVIESVLKKRKIPKSKALLIGDSYLYDYCSAKSVGVDSLLIKTAYMKQPARGRKIQRTIKEIEDILK